MYLITQNSAAPQHVMAARTLASGGTSGGRKVYQSRVSHAKKPTVCNCEVGLLSAYRELRSEFEGHSDKHGDKHDNKPGRQQASAATKNGFVQRKRTAGFLADGAERA